MLAQISRQKSGLKRNKLNLKPENEMKITVTIATLTLILGASSWVSAQEPIVNETVSKDLGGTNVEAKASLELDQRTSSSLGAKVDENGEFFAGAEAKAGAGLYGNAEASHSGKIGDVEIRNSAEVEAFVGTEAEAKAGISNDGVEIGGSAFAGARVEGSVGTEIGPAEAKLKGEAWSGAGVEAGADAGFDDGKLTIGVELGAAIGVGGKVGTEVSLDFNEVGNVIDDISDNAIIVDLGPGQIGTNGFAINPDEIISVGQQVGGELNQGIQVVDQWGQQQMQNVQNDFQVIGNGIDQGRLVVDQWGRTQLQGVQGGVQNLGNDIHRQGQQIDQWGRGHIQNIGNDLRHFDRQVDQRFQNANQWGRDQMQNVRNDFHNSRNEFGQRAQQVDQWGRNQMRNVHNDAQAVKNTVDNQANKAKNTVNNTVNGAKNTVNKAKDSVSKFIKNPFGK
jgi:hypothetical protein